MTDLDRQHDEIFRKAEAAQNRNTENSDSGVYATANAPQLIQVETLGKHGLLLLLICSMVAAVACVGFIFVLIELNESHDTFEARLAESRAVYESRLADARAVYESMLAEVRARNEAQLKTVNAKYEVLQYDQQALKAQLVAKGIYEGTEH